MLACLLDKNAPDYNVILPKQQHGRQVTDRLLNKLQGEPTIKVPWTESSPL